MNITGNLFQIPHNPFGDPALVESQLGGQLQDQLDVQNLLTSIVADWRYVIPDDTVNPPNSPAPIRR